MPLLSFPGKRPSGVGKAGAPLASCPASPNCVASAASDRAHTIAPFMIAASPSEAWAAIRSAVAALPRVTVVTYTADYLHAECRSAVFGFVDDLELQLRPEEGVVAVRSASRLGYADFGVNRRRIERISRLLRKRGAVR